MLITSLSQIIFKEYKIVVGACTYKRPEGLERLLRGIAAQKFKNHRAPHIEILIVDNEGSEQTRKICAEFIENFPLIPLNLKIEPQRGISFARNTTLDNVPLDCDFLAMVDDDELPDVDWLENLLLTQSRTLSEIVRGSIVPFFPEHIPQWVIDGEYFGWPGKKSNIKDGQAMSSCSTSNVLIEYSCIKDNAVRFDTDLSLTGGEDVIFFNELMKNNCSVVYSAKAAVREYIPESRTSLMSLVRLGYRYGNNKLKKKIRLQSAGSTWRNLLSMFISQFTSGIRHVVLGLGYAFTSLLPVYRRRGNLYHGLIRTARGFGQLSSVVGISYEYYK